MKKGASHVDWAISMGIFLVFIMLTFIFLRPGTEPIYKGDVLLNIVEEGLDTNGTFTLDKGFLMIEPEISSDGEYWIRIKNPSDEGFNPNWKINKIHLGLVNSILGTTPYDLKNDYCASCSPYPDCCDTKDVLDIKAYLIKNKKNIFWFVYSEDIDYPESNIYISYIGDNVERCVGTTEEIPCLLDKKSIGDEKGNFTYKFGVIERLTGFSASKLEELDQITGDAVQYDELKVEWGIPTDRNFTITIKELI